MRVRVPAGFAQAQQLELAWAERVDTLYKFRSYSGPSRRWVRQILKNSRIYFSTPSQFNDPFDVSPIFRYSGDPSDPKYVAALLRNQTRMAERDGFSAKDVAALAAQLSATVHELPGRVELEMRRELREKARMLCLSAAACPASVVPLRGQPSRHLPAFPKHGGLSVWAGETRSLHDQPKASLDRAEADPRHRLDATGLHESEILVLRA